jgi:hypothetical protein
MLQKRKKKNKMKKLVKYLFVLSILIISLTTSLQAEMPSIDYVGFNIGKSIGGIGERQFDDAEEKIDARDVLVRFGYKFKHSDRLFRSELEIGQQTVKSKSNSFKSNRVTYIGLNFDKPIKSTALDTITYYWSVGAGINHNNDHGFELATHLGLGVKYTVNDHYDIDLRCRMYDNVGSSDSGALQGTYFDFYPVVQIGLDYNF